MAIVPALSPGALPTTLAPLPRLLASTQPLGLERYVQRPKRGVPTLALALVWLVLARRARARRGRRLAGVVAASAVTGVPCSLGFARSAPIRRCIA